MKTIVIYRSKTGYTEKYARWISDELGCDIKKNAELCDIMDYDMIICGGGMYAGTLNGGKLIMKNLEKLSGKKIILFAVGANPGADKNVIPFWNKTLTSDQQKTIGHFFLRGGFDYNKLGKGDKLLMLMLKKHIQRIKNPTEEDLGMLAAYDVPVDFTEKENIRELIDYARKVK